MLTLRDRFRGLMVGIGVGDALGFPIEGRREVGDAYIEEILTRPRYMRCSDDAAMAIQLVRSLLWCRGFSGEDMSRRFAEAYFEEPWRGYGRGIRDVFERVRQGMDWQKAAAIQFDGAGSYGNGGSMRVAPVALWAYPDLEKTVRLARETAAVTHTHPVGIDGAVMQAVAAHHALSEAFDPDVLLNDLDRLLVTDEFRDKLEMLPRVVERGGDEYAGLHLGNWVAANNSVPAALYSFLAASDFEETMVRAIRVGGDTDTIAAMAGALAGSRYGLSSVPERWREVEGFETLVGLADAIFEQVGE